MWRLEMEFQRFLQVGESLFFGFTLASNVEFEALRDIPLSFAPNGRFMTTLFHTMSGGR